MTTRQQQQQQYRRRVILHAIRLLRRDGWVQGINRRGEGRCASQAVYEAHAALAGSHSFLWRGNWEPRLVVFNDRPGRTLAEVCAHLRTLG